MPASRDNRLEVLQHGTSWTHEMASYDAGNIVVDTFDDDIGRVRVVWLRTPWKDTGKFAGAVFSERATRKDHDLWSLRGRRGLIQLLQSKTLA